MLNICNNIHCLSRNTALILLLGLMLLGGGCSLAPDYARPAAPVPGEYAADSTGEGGPPPAWNDFFHDETMRRVIGLALENNRDLRVSLLNIEKTRAQYQIQRADLLPTINAGTGANIQHLPADFSGTGSKMVSRQYSASLGFSAFELDLFGRVRNLTQQALENFHAVEEDAKTAQLSLVAECAAVYLQLVADRELYDLTAATLENRQKSYDLIMRKFEAGIASDLEVSQARSILDEARANLAASAATVGQDENYLALLMGCPIPDDLPEVRRLADVRPLADLPQGLPSELLERRPDIVSAEHSLKAANASIGAARANFFPSISLTGSLGKMSLEYDNLFDGAARTWSFIPQITLPIFDTGRNMARLEVSEADRDIAVARYEKAIQTAFREVADALVQREHIDDQLAAQESLVAATGRSCRHASDRYDAGVSAYINVLDAERSLYTAQSGLIAARLLRESNALTLYKALGGGWE